MPWRITRDKLLSKKERDRLVNASQERAMADLAKGRKTWVRRWMLIDLALFSGLRVSEIASLKIGDLKLNGSEKMIVVRNGKTCKNGYVIIHENLAEHLKSFIAWKKTIGENIEETSPLLTGSKDERSYSTSSLQKEFKKAAKNAGLTEHYSIHCCRHTFATHLLQSTKNIRFVQKQCRHSSLFVTSVYMNFLQKNMADEMENFQHIEPEQIGKDTICILCKKKVEKPAKQIKIDGREIQVCLVCFKRLIE